MDFIKDPAVQRNLLALASMLTTVLNNKLNLGLTPDDLNSLSIATIGLLAASFSQEKVKARAKKKGEEAAKAATQTEALDAVKAAVEEGKK